MSEQAGKLSELLMSSTSKVIKYVCAPRGGEMNTAQTERQESFLVVLDTTDIYSISDLRAYLTEAIEAWRKGLNPESDIFNVGKLVKSVKRVKKETKTCAPKGEK